MKYLAAALCFIAFLAFLAFVIHYHPQVVNTITEGAVGLLVIVIGVVACVILFG